MTPLEPLDLEELERVARALYLAFWTRNGTPEPPTWDRQADAIIGMWRSIASDALRLICSLRSRGEGDQGSSCVSRSGREDAPSSTPHSAGWVLVPLEPTEAMIAAAETAVGAWRKTLSRDEALARSYMPPHGPRKFIASATPAEKHAIRWKAMIDASPSHAEGVEGWRPIETIPEGVKVWLFGRISDRDDYFADGVRVIGLREGGRYYVTDAAPMAGAPHRIEPTHWQPLPSPPPVRQVEGQPRDTQEQGSYGADSSGSPPQGAAKSDSEGGH